MRRTKRCHRRRAFAGRVRVWGEGAWVGYERTGSSGFGEVVLGVAGFGGVGRASRGA